MSASASNKPQPPQKATQQSTSYGLCGAGCFSGRIRQEMRVTNPDGQLANVSMSRIDALSVQQLRDLDIALVSFVHQGYPYKGPAVIGAPQELQAMRDAFLAAGIVVRVREIGSETDYGNTNLTQKVRLTRAACHQYMDGRSPNDYSLIRNCNAQMFETLVETCRYRGLFNSEGNCISIEDAYIRKFN